MRSTQFKFTLLTLVAVLCSAQFASAFPSISAKKGKEYKLSDKHGPWMVMVASFSQPDKAYRSNKGLSPAEAASQLVYELRQKGVPAYTFTSENVNDTIKTFDRRGEERERAFRAQKGAVCVLAGNYKSKTDKVGQKTLKWIENNFSPKLLASVEKTNGRLSNTSSGGVFRSSSKSPLKGAFLTINPILTPEDAQKQFRKPLLAKLNPPETGSIRENKGKYTLIVASFYGKSVTSVGQSGLDKAKAFFDKGNDLARAKKEAWTLARHMRKQNIKAFVFHDRYKSVVTVGEYSQASGQSIHAQATKFGAKMRWDLTQNKRVLSAETITVPYKPTPRKPITQKWIFDPQPRVMEVPTL